MKRFALAGLLALLFISDADAQVFRRRAVVITSPGVGVSSSSYSGYSPSYYSQDYGYSQNYGYPSGTVIQAGYANPYSGYSNYGNWNYGNSNYGYSNYGRYNNSYSPYGGGYRGYNSYPAYSGYNSPRYGNYYGGRRGW